jgi:hypothetical protein
MSIEYPTRNFYLSKMKGSDFVGLLAVVALVACSREEEGPSSFGIIQTTILETNCAISGCHAGTSDPSFQQHGLILTGSAAFDQLINRPPKNANALRDGLLLVKPFKADQSLLFHKLLPLDHHSNNDYGNLMPLGLRPLTNGEIEFIRRWIEAGAPFQGNVVDEELLKDTTRLDNTRFEPLVPPPAGQGFQLKLDPFPVAPKFEREFFVYKKVGNTTGAYVNRFEIKMRANSHHFILYDFNGQIPAASRPAFNTVRDIRSQTGDLIYSNMLPMAYHVFVIGSQSPSFSYAFPSGTALYLPPDAAFDMNSHYVNKSFSEITGEVNVNLHTVPQAEVKNVVRAFYLGNQSLELPPNQRTTATKTFTMAKKTFVVALTSHTHQLGEKFVIKISGGARDGEIVYTNNDWHHPPMVTFNPPIALNPGEGLTSAITYRNTSSTTVRFGLTSQDEMGIIFGYYYEE